MTPWYWPHGNSKIDYKLNHTSIQWCQFIQSKQLYLNSQLKKKNSPRGNKGKQKQNETKQTKKYLGGFFHHIVEMYKTSIAIMIKQVY